MGATTFETIGADSDPRQAFTRARAEAMVESGACGYTGTIAEKDAYVVVDRTPRWRDEAARYAGTLVNDPRVSDKWGPAGALPVAIPGPDEQVGEQESVEVVVELGHAQLSGASLNPQWSSIYRQRLVDALLATLNVRPEHLVRWKVNEQHTEYEVHVNAPVGEPITRYVVAGTQHADWETAFATRKEAIDAIAKTSSDRIVAPGIHTLVVEAISRIEGGPLASVDRVPVSATLHVTATINRPAPVSNGRIDGWLFFGRASC